MSVNVISWQPNGLKGKVVISGDSFSEAASTEAKTKAIEEARRHLGLCGISGSSGPYPVDKEGNELNDIKRLSEASKAGEKLAYHNEYDLMQSIAL